MQERSVLVICPHADDGAIFCGGQIMRFVEEGWRVALVRVTNDETDSVGLSREETIRRNTEQLHAAARILGVADVIELDYVTDCLGDVSRVELREKFIRLFRQHRPYAVMSFDPYAQYEPNLDHVVVSQAIEEAYWTATFDKHHPEHLEAGLQPHSVCERWYYARRLPVITAAVDISDVIERKIAAVCAHTEMMRNTLNQLKLQLMTWGGAFRRSMRPSPPGICTLYLIPGFASGRLLRAGLMGSPMLRSIAWIVSARWRVSSSERACRWREWRTSPCISVRGSRWSKEGYVDQLAEPRQRVCSIHITRR